ncbi:Ppx/GppA phosphatase family protein [Lentzea terrae]|uniref:Ppx/GppA phosphatase family protein n=1 Tax=Lentzea terrae TaxID=2200761 RepID=UPI002FCDC344
MPLGAGRLTRAMLAHDPPKRSEVRALRRYVRETLSEVVDRLRWESVPRNVVATSKTFKQLARLAGAPPQREGPFVRRVLTMNDVRDWIPRLARMSAAQRARLRGVSQPRARQILAGAVVAHATMSALGVERLRVCPWALREGIMLRHLETNASGSAELPLQALVRNDQPDATVTPLHQ